MSWLIAHKRAALLHSYEAEDGCVCFIRPPTIPLCVMGYLHWRCEHQENKLPMTCLLKQASLRS